MSPCGDACTVYGVQVLLDRRLVELDAQVQALQEICFFRKVHCVHFLLVPANIMGETGHKHYDNKIPLHEDSDGAVSEAPSFFPKQFTCGVLS